MQCEKCHGNDGRGVGAALAAWTIVPPAIVVRVISARDL